MSFSGLQPVEGPFFLAPGGSMRIWVTIEGGQDRGAQSIMADPVDEGQPVSLTVSELTKERNYRIGKVTQNGAPHYTYSDPYIRYLITVTNTGNNPAHFTVQGGGVF